VHHINPGFFHEILLQESLLMAYPAECPHNYGEYHKTGEDDDIIVMQIVNNCLEDTSCPCDSTEYFKTHLMVLPIHPNENGPPISLFFYRFQRLTATAAGLLEGQDNDYEGEKLSTQMN
jgi:hypothetical protein